MRWRSSAVVRCARGGNSEILMRKPDVAMVSPDHCTDEMPGVRDEWYAPDARDAESVPIQWRSGPHTPDTPVPPPDHRRCGTGRVQKLRITVLSTMLAERDELGEWGF